MFGFFKKKEAPKCEFIAPQTGTVVKLEEVPDPVFAEKMLGDGVATIPTENTVYAPVSGVLADVAETKHAYCITTEDGLDVLVHIGIDTVKLEGEGLKALVKTGDKVKAGDPIAEADLAFIQSKGYQIYTPVIITNIDAVESFTGNVGPAEGGKTVILTYNKK